jgi:hypothetical protein
MSALSVLKLNVSQENQLSVFELKSSLPQEKKELEGLTTISELFMQNIKPFISSASLNDRIIGLKIINDFLKAAKKVEKTRHVWVKENFICPACYLDAFVKFQRISAEANLLKLQLLMFDKTEAERVFPKSCIEAALESEDSYVMQEKFLLLLSDPL